MRRKILQALAFIATTAAAGFLLFDGAADRVPLYQDTHPGLAAWGLAVLDNLEFLGAFSLVVILMVFGPTWLEQVWQGAKAKKRQKTTE